MTTSGIRYPSFHPGLEGAASEVADGTLSRREFLSRATALGLSSTAAYGLLGAAAPKAHAQDRAEGGTLRIQMDVRALKDPRTYDWPQMANVTRGWLEYLAEYQRDGTITPMLLESWEVSDDATEYTLNVRPGITWWNGDAFTAEHVAHNIERWCERDVEGNAMAARFGSLIDDDTGKIRDGAIEIVDDTTLKLTLGDADITIIPSFTDYPAAVVHPDFDGDPLTAIGTGPYMSDSYEVGVEAVLVPKPDFTWWGAEVFGPAPLDEIRFIDLGTDASAVFAAADSGEVDMVYESVGDFVDLMDTLGWVQSETPTNGTVVIRPNQKAEVNGQTPYADARVRRALSLASDNATLLQLGYGGRGTLAANHHVSPLHPEYADIGPSQYDPEQAMALMEEAGMADYEHELISIDDDWRRNTCDAMAAQLRDAGINVKRTVLPGATFWNDWVQYPFSATDWGGRPLGVQTLSLAYRSGVPWNESGFSNDEFDALLDRAKGIPDPDERRVLMEQIETILREEGVITQPYWRSIYRHYREDVVGAEMHPVFEIHLYKLGRAA
ncbi:ABC transporter substrate-binding protein [Maribius pontilimi]|uniref:ABC transporter substrate-binding protein n=1 Tax=Palleronia pontilimi TaxID=1964209 RepID=A0A934IF29_9RHOB|nr:ABC transporter substrate-binding protein [Palleronia pontilimi]MBJ3762280.1 ABC transporter substrate-binding protein [Palleronia pontilimi]